MDSWKHINFEQRKVISSGIVHKYKVKEIAEALGFDPTSISKEVKRNRHLVAKRKKYFRVYKTSKMAICLHRL